MVPYKKKIYKTYKYEFKLLLKNVKNGHKETVRQLLAEDLSVNSKIDSLNNTLLHWAIINFHDIEIVQMLLEKGADIHAKNKYNQKPLDIAIAINNKEVLSLLLSEGTLIDTNYLSLIFKAAKNKNENIIKLLVNNGLHEKQFPSFAKAVYLAVCSNSSNIYDYFFPFCASVFASKLFAEYNDFAYVFFSVENGNVEFIKEVLSYNFNVNVINKYTGLTLLHTACIHQHQEIVELLLKYDADVNAKVSINCKWLVKKEDQVMEVFLFNRTPLYIAVFLGDLPITRLLLCLGAELENEPYLLNNACQITCKEIVEDLVMLGMNVNFVDKDGGTPLYYCVTPFDQIKNWEPNNSTDDGVKSEMVELLLSKGANPNLYTHKNKYTPLFAAVFHGCLKTVKVLLKHKINVHHTDAIGNTPLHLAVLVSNKEMIDILLEYNFDLNVKNHAGLSPFNIAAEKENVKFIEQLIRNNVIFKASSTLGITPIHWTCLNRNEKKIATYFLNNNNNIEVSIKDKEDKTTLEDEIDS